MWPAGFCSGSASTSNQPGQQSRSAQRVPVLLRRAGGLRQKGLVLRSSSHSTTQMSWFEQLLWMNMQTKKKLLPGLADYSREYVHLTGQNHQTADPWHYGSAHTSGQRQTKGLRSAQRPLWGMRVTTKTSKSESESSVHHSTAEKSWKHTLH